VVAPRIAVVVNAAAGTAKSRPRIETEIARLFHEAGCRAEVIALGQGQNPTEAAKDAMTRASVVVAAGGDGTVSGVAAGVVDSDAALGILPVGTLNHFAKDLHIPIDLTEAVAVVVAGHQERVDVGRVNGRVFVNNSSIGVYPGIVEAREELQRQGYGKFAAMAMATLRILRQDRRATIGIDVGGHRRTWRTPFVFIGNNEYAVEGLRLGARDRLDQGRLFVYVAPRLRTRQLPLLLAKAVLGRARHSGDFEIMSGRELSIDVSAGSGPLVACDGEVLSMTSPLTYQACAQALSVIVPRR
jgi:diacylglycerol kinase family enzyme